MRETGGTIQGVQSAKENKARKVMKRLLDILAVLLFAPLWLPLLALAALGVRVAMGSPVVFQQERAGLGGRPFTILKLRTMRTGQGTDEERLTPFGRFLRKTSLDELPQLFNVLRGEMSLVGPRPLPTAYLPLYSAEQRRRHEVRPGITGWAQVNGRNAISWERKFELDVEYVDRRSLLFDLRILLMTVGAVLSHRGISDGSGETMKPFG